MAIGYFAKRMRLFINSVERKQACGNEEHKEKLAYGLRKQKQIDYAQSVLITLRLHGRCFCVGSTRFLLDLL